ncbi:flagellar hook assembly protein FlgD [Barrientosiimonas marina]|uniref:Flagellar hook assembly protein FlgD n=1 Tax=Lentibacillus kimchii TaxID=1542911 RepID=A0ABW2URC6_9BACI
MTSVDSSLYLQNQSNAREPSPKIGKDGFLQILMTQLQNQDPTSPMDEGKFVSQMATFSQLEQTMNMADSIDKLSQKQNVSPILQYSHLIDQSVTYQRYDEETGEKQDTATAQVTAVGQHKGKAVLELANGENIYADVLVKVGTSEAGNNNSYSGDSVIDKESQGS